MVARLSGEKLADRLEDFRKRDISLISDYAGSREKSTFKCLKINCGHNWSATFNKISNGRGCPKCSGHFVDENSIQKKIKTLKIRSIELISCYGGVSKRHSFRCLKTDCYHEWKTSFDSVFNRGTGCPKCVGVFIDESSIQQKIEQFKLRFIKLVSASYLGTAKYHEFECLKPKCVFRWRTLWRVVDHQNGGCPKCAGRNLDIEERSAVMYRENIRSRISTLFKTGSINIPIHRNDTFMNEILVYCKTQFGKIPMKPDDDRKWQLDHIIPLSKFDHTNIDHVKLCWDARNLQWLLQSQNCSKGSKLMPEYFTEWHYEILEHLGLKVAINS